MTPRTRIALVILEEESLNVIKLRLQSRGYQVLALTHLSSVLGVIYSDPPDVVMVDLSAGVCEVGSLVTELKRDSYFSMIPVIGFVERDQEETMEWEECPLDELVVKPIHFAELFTRIALSIHRIQRVFDHNPLTKLPGNTSIQRSIEKSLGQPMAVCYLDINHFKPYNDLYGFSRGDEVIRMVARIISNAVRESRKGGFVGHIGGDDFVFVVPEDQAEIVSQMIIDNFRLILSTLFGETEKAKGYYMARNRKGQREKIPLLGLAIAIVPTARPQYTHCGKVIEAAAELKTYAKRSSVSRYVVDRRKEG